MQTHTYSVLQLIVYIISETHTHSPIFFTVKNICNIY